MTWTTKANLRGPAGYNATDAAQDDAAIADFIDAPTTPTETRAAVARVAEAEKEHPGSSLEAALPNTFRKVAAHNDVTGTPLIVASVGTSIEVGATLPDPATQSPGAILATKLAGAVNRLGNITVSRYNGAVNGSVTNDLPAQYAAIKAAVGVPSVLVIVPGMNDGMIYHYHSGQTYPGVYSAGKTVIETALADGCDVVIYTTPHPHTTRTPWTAPASWAYPQASPAALKPAAGYDESVNDFIAPSGETVPGSYRHHRVNQTYRRLAAELGVVLIDAERYWFDAVADRGEDALFNTAEYAHPNLLGHQLSFHRAAAAFARSLTAAPVHGGAQRTPVANVRRKVNNGTNATNTLATDSQLTFYAAANTVWEIDADLFYSVPTANDLRVGWEIPAGSTGRHGTLGAATTATTLSSEVTARSFPIANALPLGGNTTDAWGKVRAVIAVGATGGNIGLQYATDTAGGTATLFQHSMIRARQIS